MWILSFVWLLGYIFFFSPKRIRLTSKLLTLEALINPRCSLSIEHTLVSGGSFTPVVISLRNFVLPFGFYTFPLQRVHYRNTSILSGSARVGAVCIFFGILADTNTHTYFTYSSFSFRPVFPFFLFLTATSIRPWAHYLTTHTLADIRFVSKGHLCLIVFAV